MFVDDRPEYPMTFVVQFEFSGSINRTAFQDAIDQALERHPLLRSHIQPAKLGRDCWVSAEVYDSTIDWGNLDDPIITTGAGAFLDMREEIGFRGWVRHNEDRAVFTAVFHHSCADGIGAYHFLGDVLWFYAKQLGEECGPLPEYDDQALRKRLRMSVTPELWARCEKLKVENELSLLANHDSHPLLPHQESSVTLSMENEYPRFSSHTFDKTEFRKLRLESQDAGLTINDRLLASLIESLLLWNEDHGQTNVDEKSFSVLMPLDLRTSLDDGLSAANIVTSAFVRRQADEIRDRNGLRDSLREELIHLKQNRHLSEFMTTLVASPFFLEDAANAYDNDKCHATVILSNAGDPTKRFHVQLPREKGKIKAGNLILEDLSGASPLRNATRASFNVFTYSRQLKICLRSDPRFFTASDSQVLLDHLVNGFVTNLD